MPDHFIRTNTILDKILEQKIQELAQGKSRVASAHMTAAVNIAPNPRDFVAALRRDTVALIAEIKHASPSRGILIDPFDPLALGQTYDQNGAAAISVLTDQEFFKGHLNDLAVVRRAVKVPVLRKDFLIDEFQVYQSRAAGADAILLITAVLDDVQLDDFYSLISDFDLAALVEVHNEQELERALRISPQIIGINNRDLKTFEVDLDTTARLIKLIPPEITVVAESGIFTGDDVRKMGELGVHAVLVGEALVKAENIAAQVRDLSSQERGA